MFVGLFYAGNLKNYIGVADLPKKKNSMIIIEVMAPQVPDINDKTWEPLRELWIWVYV